MTCDLNQSMISSAEKEKRRESFAYAVASFELEGFVADARLVKKAEDYIDGKMSLDDLMHWYDEICKKDDREG